ncbi:MAG: peroxidase [Planctomycetota bacterium]|nr:peroxidase [Planctomycetota bacterium]
MDTLVVDSVRNFLFGPPGAGGLDLASLNIQRGRDHGLADYNTIRAAYNLPRVTSFAQITSNTDVQAKLQSLYGSVDKIDAWVGALAEDHVAGGSTGPLIRAVLSDQFARLRDGDRFWYQRAFSDSTVRELDRTSLSDIIRRNTTLSNVQDNTFYFRIGISGTVFGDANRDGRLGRQEQGLSGRTVELLDVDTGTVVATATTDRRGRYSFDVSSGLRLGRVQVRVKLADGQFQTTSPRTIALTRGETFVSSVDLGVTGRSKPWSIAMMTK